MVEIPYPPPLELTQHEREVIQHNREYQQALKDQNEALLAAATTAKHFLAAYTKLMQARFARDQTVAGISISHSLWGAPPASMNHKELMRELSCSLPTSPTELEALVILMKALKHMKPAASLGGATVSNGPWQPPS